VCIVDVFEWRFYAQEAVSGDESAVISEGHSVLGGSDSEEEPEGREFDVRGVSEEGSHTYSSLAVSPGRGRSAAVEGGVARAIAPQAFDPVLKVLADHDRGSFGEGDAVGCGHAA
jgi:hypothetical protein